MKRKADRDLACEAASVGPSATNAAKKRRGGQLAPKTECKALPAPQVAKRPRGRPPSEKTRKKRAEREARDRREAAEAFALELAKNSPVVKRGPSVDDQVRRLQQEDADGEAGDGRLRRRSVSMERLYGRTEQKAPCGSRLRSASTGDPEELKAALEDEDFTEAENGVEEDKERAEAEDDMVAEQPAGKPASPVSASAHGQDSSSAEAEQAAAVNEHAETNGQPSADKPASSAPATVPAASGASVKAASAPVTPATAGAEQDLEALDAKAAAFAAVGSASAAHRPSSAPTLRRDRRSSPAPTPTEQAPSKGSPAPTKPASPEDSSAPAPAKGASPKGSPASTPKRRLSPGSTPVLIPLGKAAEQNGGPSPLKRARQSPPEPAGAAAAPAAAGPRAAAATPAAQARVAKLTKRAKEPSKLQLDSVHRRRLTRAGAPTGAKQSSASPPQQPDLAQAPAQPAEPSAQPREADDPAHKAAGSAPSGSPAVAAAEDRPELAPVVAAPAVHVEKRGNGPMANLLDKPKAPSPRVTAITAPRPVAATEHRLSRLTDSSQESALTGVTPKVEESPEAVEERRQLQKQQEQDRKAIQHQKVLKQIEAGLDKASTGHTFIRDMTVLLLAPAAQGLEPRIVRGILERIEQEAGTPLSDATAAASEANSKRKVALLYVLDSALKNGKAREVKQKDPSLAKSMQRFCNAVAAGLPALLRATQNDPLCYDKTLRVFQVWHDRDILAKKVLEPHLEQLKSHPVVAPPAEEPDVLMEPAKLDDFGLELANDDDSSDEGGWGDDDAAPTLKELPKLPQVEEAHKAPWQRSGGTDRAVGAAPDSPEGSPWHQGPSPSYSLPGEAYPGPAGHLAGSETPPFEEKAARAPWHQQAPAERPVQNGGYLPEQLPAGAPPHLRPMYPHQMAAASYPLHASQAQPQAPAAGWQPRPHVAGPASIQFASAPGAFPQAQRQGPMPMPLRGAPTGPITLLPPGHAPQPQVMGAMQHYAPPQRQPGAMLQPNPYMDYGRQGSVPEPGFMPPLPPDEPPPLPDEAPPPLPDEAPPPPLPDEPLPEDEFDIEMADAAHLSFPQQPIQYQQPAYSYGQG